MVSQRNTVFHDSGLLAARELGGEPFVSPEGLHVADDAAMAAMVGFHRAVTAGRGGAEAERAGPRALGLSLIHI